MNTWKALMRTGNHHFAEQRYLAAKVVYEQALTSALGQLNEWPETDEVIVAVATSRFNLADLYVRWERPEQAWQELKALYAFLLAQLDCHIGKPAEMVIHHGLRRCYSALLLHQKTHSVTGSLQPLAQPRTEVSLPRQIRGEHR